MPGVAWLFSCRSHPQPPKKAQQCSPKLECGSVTSAQVKTGLATGQATELLRRGVQASTGVRFSGDSPLNRPMLQDPYQRCQEYGIRSVPTFVTDHRNQSYARIHTDVDVKPTPPILASSSGWQALPRPLRGRDPMTTMSCRSRNEIRPRNRKITLRSVQFESHAGF